MFKYSGFITEYTENIFNLNLWGGSHVYYLDTKELVVMRDCGFFSNVTVTMFGLFLLTIEGYEVKSLKITMTDYSNDDLYNKFFKIDNNYNLNFNDITEDDILRFCRDGQPSKYGLGQPKMLDLNITERLIKKFFTPNQNVINYYENIKKIKNVTDNNYVFIWARRTDKIEEVTVPGSNQYIEALESNNLINERIFIQTDDKLLFDEFNNSGLKFDYLEMIPFAKGYSFHRLINRTPENEFQNDYNITKDEHIIQMLCVVLFSINAKKTIVYPGNGTTVVPMYKNSYENSILFLDNKHIIN